MKKQTAGALQSIPSIDCPCGLICWRAFVLELAPLQYKFAYLRRSVGVCMCRRGPRHAEPLSTQRLSRLVTQYRSTMLRGLNSACKGNTVTFSVGRSGPKQGTKGRKKSSRPVHISICTMRKISSGSSFLS